MSVFTIDWIILQDKFCLYWNPKFSRPFTSIFMHSIRKSLLWLKLFGFLKKIVNKMFVNFRWTSLNIRKMRSNCKSTIFFSLTFSKRILSKQSRKKNEMCLKSTYHLHHVEFKFFKFSNFRAKVFLNFIELVISSSLKGL